MKETERQTQIMSFDSDPKSGQNSAAIYVFSVGERLGQRSRIVTVVVGGGHLPNVLIDSGATCMQPFRPRNL